MRWFRYNVDIFHSYCIFKNCEFAVLIKTKNENESKFTSKIDYVVRDEKFIYNEEDKRRKRKKFLKRKIHE
jgi:hypothetical protein